MTYEDTPLAYININVGGTYEEGWNLADEAGNPLLASDGWTGRCQLRTDFGGSLVATFGTGGDGTLEFDNEGNVILKLPSTFTETMAPTTSRFGNNNRALVGDLDIWQTSAPTVKFRPLFIRARVYPEVTTS